MKGKVSKQIEGFDLECTHGSISVQFVSICCRKTLIYINLIAYAATTSFDPCVQCPTKHCTKFQSIICLGLEGWQSRMGYEFAKRAAYSNTWMFRCGFAKTCILSGWVFSDGPRLETAVDLSNGLDIIFEVLTKRDLTPTFNDSSFQLQ